MKKAKESTEISRRNFLKGTATGATGITVMSVLEACAPRQITAQSEASALSYGASGSLSLPEGAKPIPGVNSPEKWDYEVDVIVIGGGGAGLSAAVTAAENGAEVILLEKNPTCGGDTSCATSFAAVNSKFQQSLGIENTPVGKRYTANLYRPYDDSANNPTMVRMVSERIGETADWLESIGVVYEPGPIWNVLPPGSLLIPIDPEHQEEGYYRWFPNNGRGFIQALKNEAGNLGVTILVQTPATAFVQEDGKVIGVKAQSDDNELYLKGKVTVIAAGGYGANRDMLKAYVAPRKYETVRYWGLPGATGDGIRMAQGLGATIYCMEEIEVWDGPQPQSQDGMTLNYNVASQLGRQKSLTVNKFGKRFFNEAAGIGIGGYAHQAAQKIAQLDHTSYTILDSTCISKEDIMEKFKPIVCEFPVPWWDDEFKEQLEKGLIIKADTIEELAEKIELDPKTLKETVDRYNELCDQGEDTDFYKPADYLHPLRTPPFYTTIESGGACFQTYGGLMFDEKLRVIDEKKDVIPGLYVAGESAYTFNSLANILTSGRLAGEFAAAEAIG